jgi:RNA polymerase sigma-70 factor, ECF subfamily
MMVAALSMTVDAGRAGSPEAVPSAGASPPLATAPALSRGELATLSVEELMTAYVAGRGEAFDALYSRVSPRVFGFLLRLTRNRERAEDLLQVTFGKIHRARASYLQGAPFLPWALAIARRSFYDEVRAAKTRKEDLSFDGTLPEVETGRDASHFELADILERALDQLPQSYREAIQLTKITGLSMTEAATVVGTSPTAVKLRVHRGYKLLRTSIHRLQQQGGQS